MAVAKPAVIAPDLYTRTTVGAQPFKTGLWPQTSECDGLTCTTSSSSSSPPAVGVQPLVAPALNQHVEKLALVIDGAPQVHPFAGNPDHHLVEVPYVDGPLLARDFGRF